MHRLTIDKVHIAMVNCCCHKFWTVCSVRLSRLTWYFVLQRQSEAERDQETDHMEYIFVLSNSFFIDCGYGQPSQNQSIVVLHLSASVRWTNWCREGKESLYSISCLFGSKSHTAENRIWPAYKISLGLVVKPKDRKDIGNSTVLVKPESSGSRGDDCHHVQEACI